VEETTEISVPLPEEAKETSSDERRCEGRIGYLSNLTSVLRLRLRAVDPGELHRRFSQSVDRKLLNLRSETPILADALSVTGVALENLRANLPILATHLIVESSKVLIPTVQMFVQAIFFSSDLTDVIDAAMNDTLELLKRFAAELGGFVFVGLICM
jgi:hypothetical protein